MAKSDPIKNERLLYGLFLDLWYANQGYESSIEEMQDVLKEMKSSHKKVKKELEVARAKYVELYKHQPKEPK